MQTAMLALFEIFSFVLVFETHLGAVHQKLSDEGSFLWENALTWFSSSVVTVYFLQRLFYRNILFIHFIYLFIF